MADTIRVRVTRSQFGYRGERYRRGDEIEVDAEVVEKHPNTLVIVETDDDGDVGGADDDQDASSDDIDYESQTMDELYALAQERDISGRSEMDKADLIDALRGE